MTDFHKQNEHGEGRVCPVERAGMLEMRLRSWIYPPRRILAPFVAPGMTALDFGCGPGVFTLPMAELVGAAGQVIAVDVQPGMLELVEQKIRATPLAKRIHLHLSRPEALGVVEKVDFILAFWVIHEVPDPSRLFGEFRSILRPGGRLLIVEPPFHVSREQFGRMVQTTEAAGFRACPGPVVFLCETAVLE